MTPDRFSHFIISFFVGFEFLGMSAAIILILFIAFSSRAHDAFDVTDRFVSLASGVDIHLNQVFEADVVCISSLRGSSDSHWSLQERLDASFPGKTYENLKSDYDLAEEGVRFRIITIDDDNPVGKIFDVYSSAIDNENIGVSHCCSRDLLARIQDTGKDRKIALVEPEKRCIDLE